MTKRASAFALSALLSAAGACGGDEKEEAANVRDADGDGDDGQDGAGEARPETTFRDSDCVVVEKSQPVTENGIVYPDSLCDADGCRVGDCDPKGASEPACNAWLLEAVGSFQAVKASDKLDLGLPKLPQKGDGDPCPGFMVTPDGAENHCCQRETEQGDTPTLKLTGLRITRPLAYGAAAVEQTNKGSLEADLYNWMVTLQSAEDGEQLATSGNALPNRDGTFTFMRGAFESAGIEFNAEGAWDPTAEVPATISTFDDGSRTLCLGPTPGTRDQTMILWYDDLLDYVRLDLPQRGITWEIPLSSDLECSGDRRGSNFELVAQVRSFLPVESMRGANLSLDKSGMPINLCAYTAGAKSCDGPASTWVRP